MDACYQASRLTQLRPHRSGGLLHRDPNRTALFSSSRSASPLPMYNRPSDRYAADRTAEDIEGQNDEALEGLSQKVKLLKNVRHGRSLELLVGETDHCARLHPMQITINIGNEVRDSTKMLNGMVRVVLLSRVS